MAIVNVGDRVTFSGYGLVEIPGVVDVENDEFVFIPDEKFHAEVLRQTSYEPESGLYINMDGVLVEKIR